MANNAAGAAQGRDLDRKVAILSLAAVVLLTSAWVFVDERGVAAMAAGIAFGWMVRHLTPLGQSIAASAPPPPVEDDAAARLRILEAKTSSLRHDLRGILSPALLTAERLLGYEDPIIRRAGEIMVKTVERASSRLAETKG